MIEDVISEVRRENLGSMFYRDSNDFTVFSGMGDKVVGDVVALVGDL